MCNAHRHSPGCGCGFGPPYSNSYSVGTAREWAEDIIEEPALAEKGLQELGWTERSIEEFLTEYSQLLDTGLPQPTLVVRINEMLNRRQTVEREVIREVLRVPLFRFSAPRVREARVEYGEGAVVRRRGSWIARVFGLGTGGSQEIAYQTENEYVAENGECKLVFVPVRIRVARVDVRENEAKVGEGLRAQVEIPKAKDQCWVRGRGIRALPRDACRAAVDVLPDEVFDYALAGNTGAPMTATRQWELNVEREVFLGLTKVFGREVRTTVKRDRALRVRLTLPAGHDYYGAKGPGALWWTAP